MIMLTFKKCSLVKKRCYRFAIDNNFLSLLIGPHGIVYRNMRRWSHYNWYSVRQKYILQAMYVITVETVTKWLPDLIQKYTVVWGRSPQENVAKINVI